jgi:hypothetical protein
MNILFVSRTLFILNVRTKFFRLCFPFYFMDGFTMNIEDKLKILYLEKKRRNGETHESLAKIIGKERSVLTRKLKGEIPFDIDELLKICSYWRIDPGALLNAETKSDLISLFMDVPMPLSARNSQEVLDLLRKMVAQHLTYKDTQTFENILKLLSDFIEEKASPKPK